MRLGDGVDRKVGSMEREREARDEVVRLIDAGKGLTSRRLRSAIDRWQDLARKRDPLIDAACAQAEMLDMAAPLLRDFSLSVVVLGQTGKVVDDDSPIDGMLRAKRCLMLAICDDDVSGSVDYLRDLRRLFDAYLLQRAGWRFVVSLLVEVVLVAIAYLFFADGAGEVGLAAWALLAAPGALVTARAAYALADHSTSAREALRAVFDQAGLQRDYVEACRGFVMEHPRPLGLLDHGTGRVAGE